MSRFVSRPTVIWVAAFLAVSCASGGTEPIVPFPGVAVNTYSTSSGNAFIWGTWDISIDPATMSATLVPVRSVEFTCNVTRFLQPPISSTNLMTVTIDPSTDFSKGYVAADIRLTHPFPGLDLYTGFDVRGAVVGNGSISGIEDPTVLYAGQNDLRLLNADGLTRWFNPTEFTTYGKLFGFTLGTRGTPSYDFTATLNGYRYFCDKLDKYESASEFFADPGCPNARGYFLAGSSLIRRYEIQFPVESGIPKFSFQYTVVASWEPSVVEPPKSIPDDFPVSANCAEAFASSIVDLSHIYYVDDSVKGGTLCLSVRVFDHQGATAPSGVPGEIGAIALETPSGLISGKLATFDDGALDSALIGEDANSATYLLVVTSVSPSAPGFVPVLVVIESAHPSSYDSGIPGFVHPVDAKLAAYSMVTVTVAGDFGWARTWGGELDDGYTFAALDPAGNSYVSGLFGGTVDFDPGPGADFHTSTGPVLKYSDVFLSKFDLNGVFQWARTWGSDLWDSGHDISVDSDGNAYVVGVFFNTVDFDPGPGVCNRTSNGYSDIFVSKFDTNGNFQWVQTWGGDSEECDYGENIIVDNFGDVYVTGKTPGTVDFDPGLGVDIHVSNGHWDPFLSKFDTSGNFQWARTWGGPSYDACWAVATDTLGNPYVVGWLVDVVDFDPGPAVDNHASNGAEDCFLSKFDGSGNFQWAQTWGGPGMDMSKWLAVDDSGNACAVGFFADTVDFDPGPGIQNHASNGMNDNFLTEFDSDGHFLWAVTWGGLLDDCSNCVSVSKQGDVCVAGTYSGTVDFDPGTGADMHTSQGLVDIFLTKFGPNGALEWARTWGGPDTDWGGGVTFGPSGTVFLVGTFADTVDFDPGPGFDYHVSLGELDDFLMKLRSDGTW